MAETRFYVVPAGTRPTRCRGSSCNALIYFVANPATGRMTPVDCDVEGGKRPSESKEKGQLDMLSGGEAAVYDGKGVSHFQTCADAEQFSGQGAR
jgi:hypothetical protein